MSYLLKLALVQATDEAGLTGREVACLGRRLSAVFTSDNTSPETSSLFLARGSQLGGLGRQLAREAAMRFLLAQLLVRYAEEAFELRRHGQRPAVFASPLPPVRQDELNECVSDSFYRELMMSPCLSGWRRGEEKMRYMHLCHEVLSRSQLNALRKLREAGIVNNNLVLLPTTSSLSLANNGTHLTLGSRRLTAALADPHSGFGPAGEKRVGDLVTKFVEHFLPLFPGVYSAAPRRLSFHDFHPERALGFLPHELDFSHLRMLWRRWRKKAHLRRFGWRWTPWGPPWMDDLFSRVFGLRGDVVPDARLIGYLACVMSTDQHPALDGELGNADRLKADLERMGVFDRRLSLYLFHRQREYARMGFSGFEGRWYSLFASLEGDLAPAAELQSLLTALAHQEIIRGELTPEMIPDDPLVESERRQIVFAAAIGVPTVFIRQQTPDWLLRRLAERCDGVRASRRYPGCWRVPLRAWQLALVRYLRERGGDLINWLELSDVVSDLESRLRQPAENSAEGRLLRGISDLAGGRDPLSIPSGEFNRAAERYYRETLRRDRCREGFRAVRELWNSLPAVGREAIARQMTGDLKALGSPEVSGLLDLLEKGWETDDLPPRHVAAAVRLLVCLAGQFLLSEAP
ncbi:MAG: hypothetical protein IPM17_04210 [Verrucomicrobia bacterium]|nr:hypothetical protein [Verrucomicrobiota bacterium]